MNIQKISFTSKQYHPHFSKAKQAAGKETTAPTLKSAPVQEVISLQVQADNILKATQSVKEMAKFAQNEARGVLYDAKQCQKQAQSIFEQIQDRIELMEFEGKHIEDYVSVIMDLSEGEELFEALIKDNKATVYKAQSKDSTAVDKYEIDLKTGELLNCKKGCHLYLKDNILKLGYAYVTDLMATQYDANEEYAFKNGKLLTCDLGVSDKDFRKIDKRFTFAKDTLTKAMFGVIKQKDKSRNINSERTFIYSNGNLMRYLRKCEMSPSASLKAEIAYNFKEGDKLSSFNKGVHEFSIATYSNKETFRFKNEKITQVIFDEGRFEFQDTFSKKYNLEGAPTVEYGEV